ncbi:MULTISPECIES: hypothetical protein [Cyanophyceae]|jgi:hypothetical protein|uniref:hypothetical protein n=1 Tax=Cyanophyceae TaxID=3028117 RepID=UPI00074D3DFE|nr:MULTISPECIES: hypothetical protein [Cyanophyceae]MBF2083147.1 hypothetical protein [Thermoleptolyngbya sp. C42_A2020_037]BAU42011.1 hypothetical protein O77CONTIG1_01829 [Leptolyngbya sp. O-77]
MSKIEPPGNPDGWGDPSPIVLIILLMLFFGSWIGSTINRPTTLEECRQILQQP